MSNLVECLDRIIGVINEETQDLSPTERGMVLLMLCELAKCTVEYDIAGMLRRSDEK